MFRVDRDFVTIEEGFEVLEEVEVQWVRTSNGKRQAMTEQWVTMGYAIEDLFPVTSKLDPVLWGHLNEIRAQIRLLHEV